MFTLKDIEMLVIPEGTRQIIIRDNGELDPGMKKEIEKQFKKTLKLPVMFIPKGVTVVASKENFDHGYD